MFAYPGFSSSMYEPRTPSSFYPRTRNYYPCSYYHHNNHSPFYNQPDPFYYSTPRNYFPYYEEDQSEEEREQLLMEQLLREQLLRKQQEHEREQELERLKNHKPRQQKQPGTSSFTTDYQPKKSFRVKIQSDEDEAKAKINKSRAAHKIYKFIKNQSANKQTRKILNKLYILHKIENELKRIQKTKYFGNLTFDKENGKQILPISIENKKFLEYEDKIVKMFDKLDGIQSEGADIIRDRRKFLVKFAQTLLDELDIEKENQWKVLSENQLNSNENSTTDDDVPMSEDSTTIVEETDVPLSEDFATIVEETDVPLSDDSATIVDETDIPLSDDSATIVEETDVPVSSENEEKIITKDEDSASIVEEMDVSMPLESEGNENIVNNNSIEPIITTISKESEPENIVNPNENIDTFNSESFDLDGNLRII